MISFIIGFYKSFYNAVLKSWKKKRQNRSTGLEKKEIQQEERVLAKMKEVDLPTAKYRLSRWVSDSYIATEIL